MPLPAPIEDEVVHVLEKRDLADDIEVEVVPDVAAEVLGEVAHDLALVDAARGSPPLALELAHSVLGGCAVMPPCSPTTPRSAAAANPSCRCTPQPA